MIRRWLAIALATMLLAAIGCGGATTGERIQYMPNDVPIAALFYPTHGFQHTSWEATGGRGSTAWNIYGPTGATDPFPWTGFTTTWPEIGWYASKDLETVRWQVAQMQRAGIDTVIISWFGWGDIKLDGTVSEPDGLNGQYHEAAIVLLDYIKDNNVPMKFAIHVEAFTAHVGGEPISTMDLTDAQRRMVTDYLWDNLYSSANYIDFALRLDEKPVVFGGADVPGGWWRNHNRSDDRFDLIDVTGGQHHEDDFTVHYLDTQPPSAIPGVDGIVTIWPRFTSVVTYASNSLYFPYYNPPVGGDPDRPVNLPELDPLGTEGAYDEGWRAIIEHPRRSEIKLIWIYYWNSYWEVCYIEPDAGIGAYAVGDLYVRKTAHYANLFRSGLPFEHFDDVDDLSRYTGDIDHAELSLPNRAEKGGKRVLVTNLHFSQAAEE